MLTMPKWVSVCVCGEKEKAFFVKKEEMEMECVFLLGQGQSLKAFSATKRVSSSRGMGAGELQRGQIEVNRWRLNFQLRLPSEKNLLLLIGAVLTQCKNAHSGTVAAKDLGNMNNGVAKRKERSQRFASIDLGVKRDFFSSQWKHL